MIQHDPATLIRITFANQIYNFFRFSVATPPKSSQSVAPRRRTIHVHTAPFYANTIKREQCECVEYATEYRIVRAA